VKRRLTGKIFYLKSARFLFEGFANGKLMGRGKKRTYQDLKLALPP
jgi:hypothetical protein